MCPTHNNQNGPVGPKKEGYRLKSPYLQFLYSGKREILLVQQLNLVLSCCLQLKIFLECLGCSKAASVIL